MKKIINLALGLVFILAVLASCEKITNKVPTSSISDETALTTYEGLQAALLGTYNALQSGDLYGGNIWACGDMLCNNVKNSGQGNIVYEETQMLEKNMSPDNRLSASFWDRCYFTINMANSIIEAIPLVAPAEEDANRLRGECLFIRAMLYFDMVRYLGNWVPGSTANGLAVPLILVPTGIDARPSRNTIDEVYAQILNDLTEAAHLLPASNSNRATKWSAKALLSRVYFYLDQYQNCIDISTEVINDGGFKLVDSVVDNFGSTVTSEIIFAVLSTQTSTSAGTLNGYYRLASNGKFSPSTGVLKVFTFTGGLEDQRYSKFFITKDGRFFTTMFDDRYMNIPLIRLAEIYLNRGECRLNLGDTPGALEDLNVVRKRAGVSDSVNINATLYYYERIKELCFQGDNFFNQKRLKRENISDKKLPWDDRRLIYLIPQREIDVNPNLVQN
ncbi:MAG: RagB/SusD family nutrient uptake outer membrane protein [Bacteroidales bacterium]|nr:RagB/SusD family nutrient uptake outer membrane protein [Bacteroidales bacterium]